jgi:pyruvate/2-oxoacid:ferredoxin oxidoreductase beta subunit
MCEMLAQITGSKFLARGAVDTPQNVLKTKQLLKKAFENQENNVGFSMVEVISQCPTNWHADVQQALEFVRTKINGQFMVIRVENQTTPTTKDNIRQQDKQKSCPLLSFVVLRCLMLFEMLQRSRDVTLWRLLI